MYRTKVTTTFTSLTFHLIPPLQPSETSCPSIRRGRWEVRHSAKWRRHHAALEFAAATRNGTPCRDEKAPPLCNITWSHLFSRINVRFRVFGGESSAKIPWSTCIPCILESPWTDYSETPLLISVEGGGHDADLELGGDGGGRGKFNLCDAPSTVA